MNCFDFKLLIFLSVLLCRNNKTMNKSTQSKNVRFNIIPLSSQVTPLDESWNELHVHVNKEDTNKVVVPSDNTEEQDIQVCCVIAYPTQIRE